MNKQLLKMLALSTGIKLENLQKWIDVGSSAANSLAKILNKETFDLKEGEMPSNMDSSQEAAIENEVLVYGPIVTNEWAGIYEWFGIACCSPEAIKNRLKELDGKDAYVRIDSPGGSVDAASAIYNFVVEHGKCDGVIDGVSASAATMIQMGLNKVKMANFGSMMIHRTWGCACGNGPEVENFGAFMKKFDEKIAKLYADRGTKNQTEFHSMMDTETWLTSDESLELGLIDEIITKKPSNQDDDAESNKDDASNSSDKSGSVELTEEELIAVNSSNLSILTKG